MRATSIPWAKRVPKQIQLSENVIGISSLREAPRHSWNDLARTMVG
jgi:hypothetical protein